MVSHTTAIRSIPHDSTVWSRSSRTRVAGDGPCPKDTGLALPHIGASSATSRRSSRCRLAIKGKLTVHRVDTAIDCGMFVTPERIQSQIEGAAIMGLSLAKYGEITFKDGKVQQGNYDDFRVIRLDEAPLVTNVHIVPADPNTPPSGVGEPGVPPFAPALINAIFAATGKRIRTLPIGKQLET